MVVDSAVSESGLALREFLVLDDTTDLFDVVIEWGAAERCPPDSFAMLLGADGRVRSDTDLVFYNQPTDQHGAVRLAGQFRTAAGVGERLRVALHAVPRDVVAIAFGMSVDEGTLVEVTDLRVYLEIDGELVADLVGEGVGAAAAATFGRIRREDGGTWGVVREVRGWEGGLADLVVEHGVQLDQATESESVPGLETAARPEQGSAEVDAVALDDVALDDVDELQIAETRRLPPDPRVMEAIGHNHDLGSAVADLVDNSIDAGAGTVMIMVVRRRGQVVRLLIVDDGAGIPDDQLDRAMSVGAGREYRAGDLGHFGIGLKAAAFSQAGSLVVVSRTAGADGAGRRWLQERARDDFSCEVLAPQACADVLAEARLTGPAGTVVRLDRLRRVPGGADNRVHRRFAVELDTVLRRHLGVVFHRFIADGRLSLSLNVRDLDAPGESIPIPLTALDPFGYRASGSPGHPKTMRLPDGTDLYCHVWPGRSELPGFKLGGSRPRDTQGFYIYRNDRLVQMSGWNDLVAPDNDLQLARVRIDLPESTGPGWRMSPQKDHVEWDGAVALAITTATAADGSTWNDYLAAARQAHKRNRTHVRTRRRTMPPGRGFDPAVRAALGDVFDHRGDPVDIRWKYFDDDRFLDVDREGRTIWLNSDYRTVVNGGRTGALNDAPLLKAALYLLAEDLFDGRYLGPREKDELAILSEVLTTAAHAERDRR